MLRPYNDDADDTGDNDDAALATRFARGMVFYRYMVIADET
jgi:hypothetical protein